ncbi:hypothetical protein [Arthrobacter sp. ISL-30]|uniref:hypothetical protein n=1 Tax=Arthrobacter sp. ISL-30 TaxID=2819109 RepID=UPI001BE7872F|nr:hypothetical protein [Arthrobacter sp. ISL-30]MBT2512950.1 hypothetical protein [Arthrobacter sp. ISL-30]
MSIFQDLRQAPRLGLIVGGTAAAIGVIYGTKGRQLEEIQLYWENGGTWPDAVRPDAASASATSSDAGQLTTAARR